MEPLDRYSVFHNGKPYGSYPALYLAGFEWRKDYPVMQVYEMERDGSIKRLVTAEELRKSMKGIPTPRL